LPNKLFGAQNPVQGCRIHNLGNVCQRLREEQKEEVPPRRWTEKGGGVAAEIGRLADAGIFRCGKILREGMKGRSRSRLRIHLRCIAASIEKVTIGSADAVSATGAIVAMVERWLAAAFLATEKNFRRITGPTRIF
jgi:hypothetical protein